MKERFCISIDKHFRSVYHREEIEKKTDGVLLSQMKLIPEREYPKFKQEKQNGYCKAVSGRIRDCIMAGRGGNQVIRGGQYDSVYRQISKVAAWSLK